MDNLPVDISIDFRLFFTKIRIKSFDNKWPFNGVCSAKNMAEAGFYCSSTTDEPAAKCFACDKELDGWNVDDNPMQEHRNHAPECLFVQKIAEGKTCQSFNIADFLELYSFLLKTRLGKQIKFIDETFMNFIKELQKN